MSGERINRTLAIVLITSLKVLSGWISVELMVSIWDMVALIPPASSTACCAVSGIGAAAPSCFWAASILSRTNAAGATVGSMLLLDPRSYFSPTLSELKLDMDGSISPYLVGW